MPTQLSEKIYSVFQECQESGVPLPWIVVLIDKRGRTICVRYVQPDDGNWLYDDSGGTDFMENPIKIVIVGSDGKTKQITITDDDIQPNQLDDGGLN